MTKIIMLILAYLIGTIPSGFIYVKLKTGQDVRTIQSGRTGGTNSMRAAGVGIGIATMVTDFAKGAAAVFLAKALLPEHAWIHVLSGLLVIIGHNYNIFMSTKDENGKWKIGGGAGGSPALGATTALWLPSFLIAFPLAFIGLYFIGYASVATIISGSSALIIFIVTGLMGITPLSYIVYGAGALTLLLISLKENIKRLKNGTERMHGYRARKKKTEE
jgi:glycerol-3-phosphate acyltransferase PlsY